MDDELKAKLDEISAALYVCKVAVHYVDDPEIIDKALFRIIKDIDALTKEN